MYNQLSPEVRNKLFFFNLNILFSELSLTPDVTIVLKKVLENIVDYFDSVNGNFYLLLNKKYKLIHSINEVNPKDVIPSEDDEKKLTATNFVLDEAELEFYPSLSNFTSNILKIKLMAPINYNNNLFGFITLGEKSNEKNYEEAEKMILSLVSNFIGKMIFQSNSYIKESGKTSDDLYLKNVTDVLSGIYARSYIEQRLNEGIKEAIRYKKPYSLLMIKIDNYNNIRTTYGLQAGNILIQHIENIIKNLLRKDIDLAGRYDEDTFIILLPSTEKKGTIIFSERLRSKLSRISLENFSEINLTTSMGVTSLEITDKNKDDVIKKVTEALNHSVRNGGNILSFNYENRISENLSDFEKATGMSATLLKNSIENPFYLIDENGNEIDFTKSTISSHWINIPKIH